MSKVVAKIDAERFEQSVGEAGWLKARVVAKAEARSEAAAAAGL